MNFCPVSANGLHLGIEFEWDETKSETCFKERGFDFAYAAQTFFDPNHFRQKSQHP